MLAMDDAAAANAHYAKFLDDPLEVDAEMFELYRDHLQLWDWRQMSVAQLGNLDGKSLLDYGCGMGEEAIYFAKLGATVTGIDVAGVGIDVLRRRAQRHGLPILALQMRAEQTSFGVGTFDLVHGLDVLHHVGLEPALKEVHRILKPGGVGVFLEPMADHPLVEKAKSLLRRRSSALHWAELAAATRRFSSTTIHPYRLLARAKRVLPKRTHELVRKLDFALFTAVPALRTLAGAAVIRVEK